jgi:hypothetical protein
MKRGEWIAWLIDLEDLWRRGDALEAGKKLYERLDVTDRPRWATRVLDACSVGLGRLPPEVREVREIAVTPDRWGEGHRAFQKVRKVLLESERHAASPEAPEHGILYLAESVAKVTYNASGCSAPFDHNAGWWVAKNARWIVDHSSTVGLHDRVWAALAGQPGLAKLDKLESSDIRPLWVHDYYDRMLSGAVLLGGKIRWFELCSETDTHRRYVIYDLTDAEAEEEERWHALFVEHVGDHWTFKEEAGGTVKPASEHAKFYDVYATRRAVDYSRNPILGWFEL